MQGSSFTCSAIIGALCWTASASAQPADAQRHSEGVKAAASETDETTWSALFGGVLNTGNTESWQLNAGTDVRLVRGRHAFGGNGAVLYGQADLSDDMEGYQDTARKVMLKARYDFFFTEMNAVFGAVAYRWDTFAGLDARVQGQVGYLRNFFARKEHRFWGEIGYDLTYDNFHPDPLPNPDMDPMEPEFLDGDAILHSVRAFVGYENTLNDAVQLATGIETLLNVERPEDVRLNWDASIRSLLAAGLQLELKITLAYDSRPVPGNEGLDTTTQLSLVYTFLEKAKEEGG